MLFGNFGWIKKLKKSTLQTKPRDEFNMGYKDLYADIQMFVPSNSQLTAISVIGSHNDHLCTALKSLSSGLKNKGVSEFFIVENTEILQNQNKTIEISRKMWYNKYVAFFERSILVMRIKSLAAAAICCVALTGCASGASRRSQTQRTVFVMDTAASVKGTASDVDVAVETLTALSALFDRYDKNSDIYSINERLGAAVSDHTKELIEQSVGLSEKYGESVSIFAGDITDAWNISSDEPAVPSEEMISEALKSFRNASFSLDAMSFADENGSIDVGSVAKGYALDKIAEQLGDECCIVSMTSSVLLHGKKSNGEKFSVSIRDPADGESSLGTLRTDECFLSTSGGSERFFEIDGKRYIHIFDLSSGMPCETDFTSVTVICGGTDAAAGGILSDFLSTLIFIEGTNSLGKFMEDPKLGIIAVTDKNTIYISENIDFSLSEDCGYKLEVWKK